MIDENIQLIYANPKKLTHWQSVVADPENKYTSPYFATLAHYIQQLKKK